MTYHEVYDVVKKITFLHFKLELHPAGSDIDWNLIVLRYDAPDTRDRSNIVKVGCNVKLHTTSMNADSLIRECYNLIIKALTHEVSELFKVDGIDIYNEHDESGENKRKQLLIQQMFAHEKHRHNLHPQYGEDNRYTFDGTLAKRMRMEEDSNRDFFAGLRIKLPEDKPFGLHYPGPEQV